MKEKLGDALGLFFLFVVFTAISYWFVLGSMGIEAANWLSWIFGAAMTAMAYWDRKKEKDRESQGEASYRFWAKKRESYKRSYQPGDIVITRVARVTFENRQHTIRGLVREGEEVRISREPDNQNDKNALAIEWYRYKKAGYKEDARRHTMRAEYERRYGVEEWARIEKKAKKLALETLPIGYVPRELAALIAPIIEKYDINVQGIVIEIHKSDGGPTGVKIKFTLPGPAKQVQNTTRLLGQIGS